MNKILFIGRFPPPVHGAAVMNEIYFNKIKEDKNFNIKRIKINYPENTEKIGNLNLRKLFWNLFLPVKTISNLLFFRPKLVYFEIAPNGIAFYRDSLLVLLSKVFRRKILFHLHARNLTNNAYSKFIFKDTKIIILSNLLYPEVESFFDKKDVFVLPNGIEDKKFGENKKSDKKPIKLLFISNMIKEKGALDALKIADELKKKINFEMIFAGPWTDTKFKEEWENYLKERKLEEYCKYAGSIYGEEKNKIFEDSDLLIFPTSYKNESFPVVVLEAFRAGIPVVAYDNGAIKEMISNKVLGEVVKKGEIKKFADSIIKISKRKSESKKIKAEFNLKYNINTVSKKLLKIIEKEI